MKSRKIMFVVSMLVCVAAFSPLAAQADWVTCTVDQAGPFGTNETTSDSRIFLTAVDPPGAWPGSPASYSIRASQAMATPYLPRSRFPQCPQAWVGFGELTAGWKWPHSKQVRMRSPGQGWFRRSNPEGEIGHSGQGRKFNAVLIP